MAMARRLCDFPGCGRPHRANGWCDGHRRLQREGLPMRPLKPWPHAVNVVLGNPVDKFKAARLEAAALRYAFAETDAEFNAAREALLAAGITLTWKSRRAPPRAHPSPDTGAEHTPTAPVSASNHKEIAA